jgi:hypothetical protein
MERGTLPGWYFDNALSMFATTRLPTRVRQGASTHIPEPCSVGLQLLPADEQQLDGPHRHLSLAVFGGTHRLDDREVEVRYIPLDGESDRSVIVPVSRVDSDGVDGGLLFGNDIDIEPGTYLFDVRVAGSGSVSFTVEL